MSMTLKGPPDGETKSARQEGIKALKKLFEAFEAQLNGSRRRKFE